MIIAAPRSGAGKTTVTLGLLAALRRRGVAARAGKSGPDYIDPAFHEAASGTPGVNLDSWAMPPALLDTLMAGAIAGADLLLIESAMGLFDGIESPGRSGAASDLAARYGVPVLLVLDVSGQSQTAAAVARGLATHAEGVRVAGVVLNRVASERHRAQVARAIEATGLPVLGSLPREPSIAVPERHLGLVQAAELPALGKLLDDLAAFVERHADVVGIAGLATSPHLGATHEAIALPPPGQRIALARDAAFSFVYPHLLRSWRESGAEISTFSPLADEAPPESCDVCWLPGGYPELHAAALAGAQNFRGGLARFAATRPVHGECGGYMTLGERLQDADGVWHRMAGLLGHASSFATRRMNLGYRQAVLRADCPIGRMGEVVRGHEFHYATVTDPGQGDALADLTDAVGGALGPSGERRGRVSGTFFHAIAGAGS